MPTVHKIAIHNKLTKMLKDAFQFKIYLKYMYNSRPLERFHLAHNHKLHAVTHSQGNKIIILTKIIKIGLLGNNVLSKSKRQTRTSLLTQLNKIPCSYQDCMI